MYVTERRQVSLCIWIGHSFGEIIDIMTIASATIVIVENALLLSPLHKLLVK